MVLCDDEVTLISAGFHSDLWIMIQIRTKVQGLD